MVGPELVGPVEPLSPEPICGPLVADASDAEPELPLKLPLPELAAVPTAVAPPATPTAVPTSTAAEPVAAPAPPRPPAAGIVLAKPKAGPAAVCANGSIALASAVSPMAAVSAKTEIGAATVWAKGETVFNTAVSARPDIVCASGEIDPPSAVSATAVSAKAVSANAAAPSPIAAASPNPSPSATSPAMAAPPIANKARTSNRHATARAAFAGLPKQHTGSRHIAYAGEPTKSRRPTTRNKLALRTTDAAAGESARPRFGPEPCEDAAGTNGMSTIMIRRPAPRHPNSAWNCPAFGLSPGDEPGSCSRPRVK